MTKAFVHLRERLSWKSLLGLAMVVSDVKISVGSFLTVSMRREAGGLRTYIMTMKHVLESMGRQTALFDPWNRMPIDEYDVFHLFGASPATYRLGLRARRAGVKLVVSPMVDPSAPLGLVR